MRRFPAMRHVPRLPLVSSSVKLRALRVSVVNPFFYLSYV